MLAHRIIPSLLCRGRQLIKGERFQGWRSCGHVMQAARIHGMRAVDELVLLDIAATPEKRGPDLTLVAELAFHMATPLAVGGGVRTVEDVDQLLRNGADKVIIGTAAVWDPMLVRNAADRFGSQAIVVALDYNERWEAVTNCGSLALPGLTVFKAADGFSDFGAGEIILTSIDREGAMNGYDLNLIKMINGQVSIPVIAHGGCGSYEHMHQAIQAGASAVAAGAFFQFTDNTPAGAARYLHAQGVEVRLPKESVPA